MERLLCQWLVLQLFGKRPVFADAPAQCCIGHGHYICLAAVIAVEVAVFNAP